MNANDALKFVIGGREDYEWPRLPIAEHRLLEKPYGLLFSAIFGQPTMKDHRGPAPGALPAPDAQVRLGPG